jgi:hypothetical protein
MSLTHSPSIITDQLDLCLDASDPKSYPRSGTAWTDRSGKGRNGLLTNGPVFNAEKGGCIEFDGDNDYVAISTYTFGNGNWTVSMLISADDFDDYNLMSNTSGGPVTNAFGAYNDKIFYRNYDGAWQSHSGNTTLVAGTWYMLTWVNYEGASASDGTMKMYVNGLADSSTFNSYTTNGGPCNAIARRWSSDEYNGKIASVHIYTKSLSDKEIAKNFNAVRGRFGI